MTSKPEDIRSKHPFNKIIKYEGVIDYKIIHKSHGKFKQMRQPSSHNWEGDSMVSLGWKCNQPHIEP